MLNPERSVFYIRTYLLLLLLLLSGFFSVTQGQNTDATIDVIGVGSSSGQTPFWIQSNRFGRYASDGSHALTRLQLHGSSDPDNSGPVELRYGADLIAR